MQALVFGCTTVLTLLGIAVASFWLPRPQCLVGVLPVLILGFPVTRFTDGKWAKLRAFGESKPSATAICAECGSELPIEQMIAHNSVYYCATCKPIFLQKLAEGCAPRPQPPYKHPFRQWWYWFYMLLVGLTAWAFFHYFLFSR